MDRTEFTFGTHYQTDGTETFSVMAVYVAADGTKRYGDFVSRWATRDEAEKAANVLNSPDKVSAWRFYDEDESGPTPTVWYLIAEKDGIKAPAGGPFADHSAAQAAMRSMFAEVEAYAHA